MEINEKTAVKYPCLMKNTFIELCGDLIVLFTSKYSGTILHDSMDANEVGRKEDMWNPYFFKPFDGVLSMSNNTQSFNTIV